MSGSTRRAYVPIRNIIGSLVPTIIITWYFIAKVGQSVLLRIVLILIAVGLQAVMVAVSTRTRKTRRSFFWGIYDLLTGNGRLPLRLLVSAVVLIAIIALCFEISGLRRVGGVPSAFIVRYVEVDLYWTALNFLGTSDGSLEPIGFSKLLTVLATVSGLMFWGMYISILINKHLEIRELSGRKVSEERLDQVLYNEPATVPGSKKKKDRRRKTKSRATS